jgi:hypothetical protein
MQKNGSYPAIPSYYLPFRIVPIAATSTSSFYVRFWEIDPDASMTEIGRKAASRF